MSNKLNKDIDFSFNLRTNAHVNFLLEKLKLEDDIQLLFTAMIEIDVHACAIVNEKELICSSKAVFSDGGKIKTFKLETLSNLTVKRGALNKNILTVQFGDDKLNFQTDSIQNRDRLAEELLKYSKK
jgi:hypothetical protein